MDATCTGHGLIIIYSLEGRPPSIFYLLSFMETPCATFVQPETRPKPLLITILLSKSRISAADIDEGAIRKAVEQRGDFQVTRVISIGDGQVLVSLHSYDQGNSFVYNTVIFVCFYNLIFPNE